MSCCVGIDLHSDNSYIVTREEGCHCEGASPKQSPQRLSFRAKRGISWVCFAWARNFGFAIACNDPYMSTYFIRLLYAEKTMGMSFDFIRQIIEHPEIINTIPDNAELDFIDKDIPVKAKGRSGKENIARYKVERVFEPGKEQISKSFFVKDR